MTFELYLVPTCKSTNDEAKNLSGENKQLLGKMLDTDGDGKLSEAEQKSVSSLLGVLDGNANALTKDDYTILSDFIKEFGNKDLYLAIEIKQKGIEKEVIDLLRILQVFLSLLLTAIAIKPF